MTKLSKQTITVKDITITAMMLALSFVVIQFVKIPALTQPQNVWVSGALINLILVIDTLICGIVSGVILSILIPLLSFVLTGGGVIAAVPLILPFIMLGNIVYIIFAYLVRGRKNELNILPISLIAGSVLKYGVMTLAIVKWVLPQFGEELKAPIKAAATIQFSTSQLIAALIGTALACMLWPVLKMIVKR